MDSSIMPHVIQKKAGAGVSAVSLSTADDAIAVAIANEKPVSTNPSN